MHLSTVFNAFIPYVAVWPMVAAAIVIMAFGGGFADSWLGISPPGPGLWFARFIIATGLQAYCVVVVMRLVGLFFRHFQDQIPWAISDEDRRRHEI